MQSPRKIIVLPFIFFYGFDLSIITYLATKSQEKKSGDTGSMSFLGGVCHYPKKDLI